MVEEIISNDIKIVSTLVRARKSVEIRARKNPIAAIPIERITTNRAKSPIAVKLL